MVDEYVIGFVVRFMAFGTGASSAIGFIVRLITSETWPFSGLDGSWIEWGAVVGMGAAALWAFGFTKGGATAE